MGWCPPYREQCLHPPSNLPESTVTGMPEIRFLGCKSHKFTVMTSHLFLFPETLWKTRAGSVCESPQNANVSWCERWVCCLPVWIYISPRTIPRCVSWTVKEIRNRKDWVPVKRNDLLRETVILKEYYHSDHEQLGDGSRRLLRQVLTASFPQNSYKKLAFILTSSSGYSQLVM